MIQRGDVVMVHFPFAGGVGSKMRPAVVVQCDRLNQRISNTLVAMVSSKSALVGKEPAHCLIDPGTPEGASSGLSYPSVVKCENIATVRAQDILRTLGRLSDPLLAQLDDCLKAALQMP